MNQKPRLLLFPASLRRDSHQMRLIRYFAARLPHCDIDILRPDEVNLPLFNQDLERLEPVLKEAMALHRRFENADGVIVSSPEYNASLSPYLKNTVDWVSRLARIDPRYAAINPFRDKPLLLAGASTGWTGGLMGLREARSLFAYVGHLVVSDQICVSDAERWLEDESYRFEPPFAAHIERVLADFLALMARVQFGKPISGEKTTQHG